MFIAELTGGWTNDDIGFDGLIVVLVMIVPVLILVSRYLDSWTSRAATAAKLRRKHRVSVIDATPEPAKQHATVTAESEARYRDARKHRSTRRDSESDVAAALLWSFWFLLFAPYALSIFGPDVGGAFYEVLLGVALAVIAARFVIMAFGKRHVTTVVVQDSGRHHAAGPSSSKWTKQ